MMRLNRLRMLMDIADRGEVGRGFCRGDRPMLDALHAQGLVEAAGPFSAKITEKGRDAMKAAIAEYERRPNGFNPRAAT